MIKKIKETIGRLFSQLHLLDLIVGAVLLFTVAIFLFFRAQKTEQWTRVTMVVSHDEWWLGGRDPSYWYVDNLEIGDASYNALGQKTAEIKDIKAFSVGGPYKKALINILLKTSYDEAKDIHFYNQKPLKIGAPLNLTLGDNSLQGIVTYFSSEAANQKLVDKEIKVKLRKVSPWLVEGLQEGLTMKDSMGRDLAVIDQVVVERAALEEFSDIRGRMMEVRSQKYYDLTLNIKLKAYESRGIYYFLDGANLVVDSEIWLFFPEVTISGGKIIEVVK